MTLPRITESMTEVTLVIRTGASPESFARGKEYFHNDAISNTAIRGKTLSGDCAGKSMPYYRVRVELDDAGIRSTDCSCPYEYGGYCKHIVALLLHFLQQCHDAPTGAVPRKRARFLWESSSQERFFCPRFAKNHFKTPQFSYENLCSSQGSPRMWYPYPSQNPARSLAMNSMPRSHLADFQKYRCGTNSRSG